MIGVGLIGAGFIGRNHFNQYEKLGQRAKVVALCDKEPQRRAGDWSGVGGNIGDAQGTKRDLGDIKPYAEWRDLLADPKVQMVDICVPTYLHPEMSIAALDAGKHVLCEKPMALTVEACDKVLSAAAKAKGRFMIAQCIRFWPECVYLKQAIDDKRFGKLKALSLRRQASTPTYSLNDWILDPKLSGGAILDLHVHDTDWALHLLGTPQTITAQVSKRNGSPDRVHSLWYYRPDLVLQIEGFWDMPSAFGFNMGFTARFEKAAVMFELSNGKPLTVFKEDGSTETPTMGPNDGYFNEIDYFLGCIERGAGPNVSTPGESREAVRMALLEKESAKTGQSARV
ncbi:MAG: Gfo/Idh/MocA family oxidoreductase, partial [Planctomycetes bacterium]|nr:Gfo/Idh/MocA family oxidoreductase [Planctomycetota bacterium]